MTITINHYLIVSLLLFAIGFFGVLVRRNFLTILMSIELMLNAVNLNLIAFSRRLSDLTGQVFSVFVITIAAGEAAIGLALTISLFRQRKTLNVEEARHDAGIDGVKELIWADSRSSRSRASSINGLLYLVSHRTKGEAHGHAEDGHGEAHAIPAAAGGHPPRRPRSGRVARAHPVQGRPHGRRRRQRGHRVPAGLRRDLRRRPEGLRRRARRHAVTLYRWIPARREPGRRAGPRPRPASGSSTSAFRLDSLSALMLAFVTFVGFLIHVYSVGYMGHDEGYGRYFAYLNLFMFAMLVLVLGGELPHALRRAGRAWASARTC